MSNFKNYFSNGSQRYYFESRYEDVSEPLKEYNVGDDGSLYETPTSKTLLGVKKNGKWGWVDANNMFVIQPVYDSGFALCFDGVILLTKDGLHGGLYSSNFTTAFQFKYKQLTYLKAGTYIARNSSSMQALVRPGDIMLTSYKYVGFLEDYAHRITYVRNGFFGEISGLIDPETGNELS